MATPGATAKPGTAATTAPELKPAAPAIAVPAEALAKLPKDVARALKARKVLVIGVFADGGTRWRPLADDDVDVRKALRHVNRYDGEVLVKPVKSSKLSVYAPLVNDLQVHQTPSVIVIDSTLKGTVLRGYVDTASIDQAIADARQASLQPNLTAAYVTKANRLCTNYRTRVTRWSRATTSGKKARTAALARLVTIVKTYRGNVARLPAPKQWRGLKSDWVKVMTTRERDVAKAAKAGNNADALLLATAVGSPAMRRLDGRFDAAGMTDCSILRRS